MARDDPLRREFITPLSLSNACEESGLYLSFRTGSGSSIGHIELAQKSDLIIVAPATANVIGKIASGIADDPLTTIIMAAACPVLIAPSMNDRMWENPIVKGNVEKLISIGYEFVGPGEVRLRAAAWAGADLPGQMR